MTGHDNTFSLHPQLLADTIFVKDLPLCKLLLANDKNYPWFILVPAREGITEFHQLNEADQHQFLLESNALSSSLEQLYQPAKLNIAALGNMVPQLHIHHIARYTTDRAWPAPVWGVSKAIPYDDDEINSTIQRVINALDDHLTDPALHPLHNTISASTIKRSGYVLAQLNIATQLYPLESHEMVDFVDNLDTINSLAEQAPGYVWRLKTDDGDATSIRYFGEDVVVNMSTWTDIESLHNFVYRTAHTDFIKRRKEWFSQMKVYSVLWWLDAASDPTLDDAASRLEMLKSNGPTADAFTFKNSWPAPSHR